MEEGHGTPQTTATATSAALAATAAGPGDPAGEYLLFVLILLSTCVQSMSQLSQYYSPLYCIW